VVASLRDQEFKFPCGHAATPRLLEDYSKEGEIFEGVWVMFNQPGFDLLLVDRVDGLRIVFMQATISSTHLIKVRRFAHTVRSVKVRMGLGSETACHIYFVIPKHLRGKFEYTIVGGLTGTA